MADPNQIRGALLEEAVLWLLEFSGYKTVVNAGNDPTLQDGPAGLEVRGRGSNHQIDAVADFSIGQPFSHAQRLLAEAKAYETARVGLGVVRNAVGVHKDVSEFWVGSGNFAPRHLRYHYQYALFSLTAFTVPAQQYAFAQDVYLVPLARSAYFAPIANALRDLVRRLPTTPDGQVDVAIRDLRRECRDALRNDLRPAIADDALVPLITAVR